MKIAIHHRQGSFSERWIDYCKKNNIEYKVVNAFDNDIIAQLKDCDAFMWHHHHGRLKDVISAKKILFALEHAGIKVFPNFKTAWHFDDKVAQKYLLEAIRAPLVPSYVFYDKDSALKWANTTTYPKVFKLKGGAGATNVSLVHNRKDAQKLIMQAFRKGFSQYNSIGNFKDALVKYKKNRASLSSVIKSAGKIVIKPEFAKKQPYERGYVYFQDFIPNNSFDTRVVVLNGSRAIAMKRFVRENDFRASGSGMVSYEDIDLSTIEISLNVANELNLQSVAFDYVIQVDGSPLIVEMSYGFGTKGIGGAPGYWDKSLRWHEGNSNIQNYMIERFIDLNNKNSDLSAEL